MDALAIPEALVQQAEQSLATVASCSNRECPSGCSAELVGHRYGRLTVLAPVSNRLLLCRCDCGTEREFDKYALLSGHTKSCGCLRKDIQDEFNRNKGEDLTGQRYGMLTVLAGAESKVSETGTRQRQWLCRCDCGNVLIVPQYRLKRGIQTDCGCLNAEADLAGQRFGMLTAKEKLTRNRWLCVCDCGNKKVVPRHMLLSGHIKSCGCRKNAGNPSIDLTGQRFGQLLVLCEAKQHISESGSKQRAWLCRCDCGNEVTVLQTSLQKGATQSCGCHRQSVGRQRVDENAFGQYKGTNITRIKKTAPGKNNTSGVVGVCRDSRSRTDHERWVASIWQQGRRIYLGTFDSFLEAVKARKNAEEKYFLPLIEEYETLK